MSATDSAQYQRMTPEQRLTAVSIDISKHPEFSQLAGVACIGSVYITTSMPTAATNGADEYYNPDFVMSMSRKQMRYVKIHETLHKSLRHCVEYMDVVKKMPKLSNVAMDYVVNGMIEEADPDLQFVERPTDPEPLVHDKYKGWSFIRVLKDLMQNQPEPEPQDGQGRGSEKNGHQKIFDPDGNEIGDTLDDHQHGEITDEAAQAKLKQQIDDALHQGKIVQSRLAGTQGVGGALDSTMRKRDTNWRQYLQEFICEICEGDEQSRFSPPNKRLLASGFVMPSHFSESTGEIIVACDTSGSMTHLYPVIFGEIARICEHAQPESVRVLWWDHDVCGDQQFKPIDYPTLGKVLKPQGGGGTRLTAVAEHIEANKYKPKAVIFITDGYIESTYRLPEVPVLFAVCDNDHFTGSRGRTIRIYS
jgi:predicted metal-dependent peptidase